MEIFQQYESSSLNQREFCRQNQLSPSTFFSKRRSLELTQGNPKSGFVRAEVVEQTTRYQVTAPISTDMTLTFNNVELSIPLNTPAGYLAQLIRELSS
ncbi:IS66 family insertion sequence element accessory protein TnpA [Vibrio aestuarianus]|uniref:IS66 family insertion sequence element accessory protein TnpA n=1 Tax=Vibrio aestuarianus TaxID=28171 RepID=UPI001FEB0FB2|nr:IS66 family insertion sequence element accessory protein TnpB [Vibrio aestuarianus]MDE1214942.1 IS66 family insertion sequence element accessory protein TnpB [Vibrio aestuarianus]MDE1216476.1 IS66 family insertion sequence element accessory protein TnpB [Vibrio aestuarianus]MDE1262530.1 IS66 family insertion sequence element accessory protein TnpB [Vibrio aestuarianus]MDE1269626.1 IS66 family insertion sequence element accessory protein TnpB [Vibrio aestuarianus]MDE1276334.1 IS66 family ins